MATFLRRRPAQAAQVSQRVQTVSGPAPAVIERSLSRLVGHVGLNYFRQLLPPAWLALCLLAATGLWMAVSSHDLLAFTACSLAFSGVLLHWPRRRREGWPWVRLLAVFTVIAMAFAPGLAALPLVRNTLYALSALCIFQTLHHLLEGGRLAVRLQRSAASLDDASLMALLPPEARDDAQRWQRGDDSKSAELCQVVQLAALWLAMTSVGACAAQPEPQTQRVL